MLLDTAQLVTVTGREYAVVTYSDKMIRQYMKRLQIKECIDVHGHDSMLAAWLVQELVVVLQTEYGMLKERQTVAIPVQEHSLIVIDICLCKIVRELLKIQYRLRNLQAIGVDGGKGFEV